MGHFTIMRNVSGLSTAKQIINILSHLVSFANTAIKVVVLIKLTQLSRDMSFIMQRRVGLQLCNAKQSDTI